jgi:phage N-6-adenine-methyltransferase
MTEGFYKTDTFKTSSDDTWTTPRNFYDRLNEEFSFSLDAAAMKSSALCDNWFGPDHDDPNLTDAFVMDWSQYTPSKTVWLNPPYGRSIKNWLNKANYEATKRGLTVVCLVPARTDTKWWHDYCIQHEIRFIKGRLKFGNQKNSAPFPSAIVVMRGE